MIFVDNSGVDIILGILPFARELLIRGTKVIFCANKEPSINDITVTELEDVIRRSAEQCTVIKKAFNLEQLLIFGSGQHSVCLDLRSISPGILTLANISIKSALLQFHVNTHEYFEFCIEPNKRLI